MRHARAQLARESWLGAVWRAAGVALRGASRREEDRVCLPEDGHLPTAAGVRGGSIECWPRLSGPHVWEEQDGAGGARGEVLAVRADEVRHAVLSPHSSPITLWSRALRESAASAVLGAARGRAVDWAACSRARGVKRRPPREGMHELGTLYVCISCDRHQQVRHAVAHRHLLAEDLLKGAYDEQARPSPHTPSRPSTVQCLPALAPCSAGDSRDR